MTRTLVAVAIMFLLYPKYALAVVTEMRLSLTLKIPAVVKSAGLKFQKPEELSGTRNQSE
jgi:hypothetical protein